MNFAIYCRLFIASLPIGEAVIKRESSGNKAANEVDNPEISPVHPGDCPSSSTCSSPAYSLIVQEQASFGIQKEETPA